MYALGTECPDYLLPTCDFAGVTAAFGTTDGRYNGEEVAKIALALVRHEG